MPRSWSARSPRSKARSKSPESARASRRRIVLLVGNTSLWRSRRNAGSRASSPGSRAMPQLASAPVWAMPGQVAGHEVLRAARRRRRGTAGGRPAASARARLRAVHWPATSLVRTRRAQPLGASAAGSSRRSDRGLVDDQHLVGRDGLAGELVQHGGRATGSGRSVGMTTATVGRSSAGGGLGPHERARRGHGGCSASTPAQAGGGPGPAGRDRSGGVRAPSRRPKRRWTKRCWSAASDRRRAAGRSGGGQQRRLVATQRTGR